MLNTVINRHERKALEPLIAWKTLNGSSNIRQGDERKQLCESDQQIGIYGELAFYKFLGGTCEQYIDYKFSANKADDVPGMPEIDVKSSRINTEQRIDRFHLYVRDREYKPSTKYVLALVREPDSLVWLPGWSYGWKLKQDQGIDRRSLTVPELDNLNSITTERVPPCRQANGQPRMTGSLL